MYWGKKYNTCLWIAVEWKYTVAEKGKEGSTSKLYLSSYAWVNTFHHCSLFLIQGFINSDHFIDEPDGELHGVLHTWKSWMKKVGLVVLLHFASLKPDCACYASRPFSRHLFRFQHVSTCSNILYRMNDPGSELSYQHFPEELMNNAFQNLQPRTAPQFTAQRRRRLWLAVSHRSTRSPGGNIKTGVTGAERVSACWVGECSIFGGLVCSVQTWEWWLWLWCAGWLSLRTPGVWERLCRDSTLSRGHVEQVGNLIRWIETKSNGRYLQFSL